MRPAPDGYVHAHSVNEAIHLLVDGRCTHASLDHDLGDYTEDGGEGYALVIWMAENDCWPSKGIRIHSAKRGWLASHARRGRPVRPLPSALRSHPRNVAEPRRIGRRIRR